MSHKPDHHEEEPLALPGGLLKAAREAQDLTIAQMAERSHLTKQVIRSIESDEYKDLASYGFVRGYLKLYAKKLGVDEALVLGPFDRWHQAQAPEDEKPADFGLKEHAVPIGARRTRWILLSALVFFGAAAAGAIYWIMQPDSAEVSLSEMSSAPISTGLSGAEVPAESEVAAALKGEPLLVEAETVQSASANTGLEVEAAAEAMDAVESNISTPVQSVDIDANSTNTASRPSESSNTSESPNLVSASEQSESIEPLRLTSSAAVAEDLLELRLSGDSWIEIKEQNGRLLLADLLRAGRSVSVATSGSFELVVGAVDATTVIFNGEILDLSGRASQNVARITLGEARN